jgi:ATP-dependent Lon protease
MDELDQKLNAVFDGKVVRKDLLHRIKKGTNVPTFVLEFLLARYCASNERPRSGRHGSGAGHAARQLRAPDEANARSRAWRPRASTASSTRCTCATSKGEAALGFAGELQLAAHRHRREVLPRQRPPAGRRHLGRGDLAHNDIEEDDYAFSIEDLRPDPTEPLRLRPLRRRPGAVHARRVDRCVCCGRWAGASKLTSGASMHFIARLAPLVEPNYNYIELGPRGTGKSYFFSEFSPYATLISAARPPRPRSSTTTPGARSAWSASGTRWPSTRWAASRCVTPTRSRS